MARKRSFTTFSLSFLDIMSCGFGAVVLFFMIINHATKDHNDFINRELISETSLLEKQVDYGKRNLAQIRNTIDGTRAQREVARGRSELLLEELENKRKELAELDGTTLAQIASINKLKADLQSIEEESRRLKGSKEQSDNQGDDLRTVVGSGNRLYLTGLKVGGDRALFLVDASASMLEETIVNIIRRRNMPDEEKIRARKWQRVLGSVEWLVAKLPKESLFQIYTFNQLATPVVAGSDGRWLEAKTPEDVAGAIEALEKVIPGRGTSLHRAFEVVGRMKPAPDNIFLITDGLPTMGNNLPNSKKVSGARRLRHFRSALKILPGGTPVNIILLPMEGDPRASSAFWRLAQVTGGSYIAPAKDWP